MIIVPIPYLKIYNNIFASPSLLSSEYIFSLSGFMIVSISGESYQLTNMLWAPLSLPTSPPSLEMEKETMFHQTS